VCHFKVYFGLDSKERYDALLCLTETNVDKVIFVGSVGALDKDIMLGEIATPRESYAYEGGSLYLS